MTLPSVSFIFVTSLFLLYSYVSVPYASLTDVTLPSLSYPIQVIDDAEGLKITTNTKYEGNNVVEDVDPNDVGTGKATESYQYDKDGNVTSVKDAYGTET